MKDGKNKKRKKKQRNLKTYGSHFDKINKSKKI